MIHRQNDYRTDLRSSMRGGDGEIKIEHLWEKELNSPIRMFSRITVEPGCSIGFHNHDNEEEVFYIISGQAEADDNGNTVILNPGDTILTGNGDGHSIKNAGNTTLVMMAVIARFCK